MKHGPQPWGAPTTPRIDVEQPSMRPRKRRRRLISAAVAALAVAAAVAAGNPSGSTSVETAGSGVSTTRVAAGETLVAATAAATTLPATITPATEPPATEPPTTVAATTTTAAPTGSAQSCDELHLFVDDDGDTWGECAPDLDGAHTRSQAIVDYLGYRELTCNTDHGTASTTCEVEAADGAIREVAIAITGDVEHDVVIRPAPTTTRPPPPPPTIAKVAALPENDCDPNYSGCVPIDSDVDCAGGSGNGPSYARGPVRVIGSDVYGLDRDGDGVGCE